MDLELKVKERSVFVMEAKKQTESVWQKQRFFLSIQQKIFFSWNQRWFERYKTISEAKIKWETSTFTRKIGYIWCFNHDVKKNIWTEDKNNWKNKLKNTGRS